MQGTRRGRRQALNQSVPILKMQILWLDVRYATALIGTEKTDDGHPWFTCSRWKRQNAASGLGDPVILARKLGEVGMLRCEVLLTCELVSSWGWGDEKVRITAVLPRTPPFPGSSRVELNSKRTVSPARSDGSWIMDHGSDEIKYEASDSFMVRRLRREDITSNPCCRIDDVRAYRDSWRLGSLRILKLLLRFFCTDWTPESDDSIVPGNMDETACQTASLEDAEVRVQAMVQYTDIDPDPASKTEGVRMVFLDLQMVMFVWILLGLCASEDWTSLAASDLWQEDGN
ncbi:hypothetical protein BJ875DRAFT_436266 [Amylocarpus encephaloides]|uniref:Uncharacterized protein n=1 Tax=Amylocarpus encephaloides TaxID=45428 RepID=A0A9P7YU87_9HELO|nr:hypothetical protein BJ875DRAFT_436266 [Amylocarpus encephaloides]